MKVPTPKRDPKQVEYSRRISAIGKSLFSSKEGLELLEHFKKLTLNQPVFNKDVEAGKQATHAAYREGQNYIIRQLVDFAIPNKS